MMIFDYDLPNWVIVSVAIVALSSFILSILMMIVSGLGDLAIIAIAIFKQIHAVASEKDDAYKWASRIRNEILMTWPIITVIQRYPPWVLLTKISLVIRSLIAHTEVIGRENKAKEAEEMAAEAKELNKPADDVRSFDTWIKESEDQASDQTSNPCPSARNTANKLKKNADN